MISGADAASVFGDTDADDDEDVVDMIVAAAETLNGGIDANDVDVDDDDDAD